MLKVTSLWLSNETKFDVAVEKISRYIYKIMLIKKYLKVLIRVQMIILEFWLTFIYLYRY